MTKTLSVAAIQKGTVIDHITAGQALRIIRLLKLLKNRDKITVGLNLPSKRLGHKDLIKIENRKLSEEEGSKILIFAPKATINLIENFEVNQKLTVHFPGRLAGVFVCPNQACVTHHEPIESLFFLEEQGKKVKLTCGFCEKQFDRDKVRDNIL